MQTTSLKHIAYLTQFCEVNGVTNVVISPGSRNAPLIIAFDSNSSIQTHLIHDERSAAFFALGLAESLDRPVALTCTSGSALLNYSPALAEAYYRQIPLLVLSADRPTELIDQGDGQTIRQENVYANFIKASYQFPNHDAPDLFKTARGLCERAFSCLLNIPQGPVHINIPLAEPLYESRDLEKFGIEPIQFRSDHQINDIIPTNFKEIWNGCTKKMVIVGQGRANLRLEQLVRQLGANPSIAVLVENTSNMQDFTSFCHCIDRTLAVISGSEMEHFAPEVLISLNGAVISKRIKAYFRKYKAKHNFRLGQYLMEEDTYQSLTSSIEIDPEVFMEYLIEIGTPAQSNFGASWKQKDFLAQERHFEFIRATAYSDLSVFDLLLDTIPDESVLHMGNSSVVRYCQLFNPTKKITYYSNRGVSGIDGSSSTAAGFSVGKPEEFHTLISGDISFFYDSNAFWNDQLKSNLKIIVISNGGGGIFQIIPGPAQSKQANTFFAPTGASVKGVCETFDLNYYQASSREDLTKMVQRFFQLEKNDRPSVLEISTKNCNNASILNDYFNFLEKPF